MSEQHRALVEMDLGKLEARILAAEGMPRSLDPHKKYAAELFGVSFDEVTPTMRNVAKQRRFLENYSAGPDTIKRMATLSTPLTKESAKSVLERFNADHAQLRKFWDRLLSMRFGGR